MKFKISIKKADYKALAQSYARHIVPVMIALILATAKAHNIAWTQMTKSQWLEVANGLWLAAIPQIRHFVTTKSPDVAPLIDAVLPESKPKA